jgi:Tfp pilus assembly protein PilF
LWKQVIQLEGGAAAIHVQLAEAFAGAGHLEQAVGEFRKAISLEAWPEAHRRLAEVYAQLGRPEDSRRAKQEYVERRLALVRPF